MATKKNILGLSVGIIGGLAIATFFIVSLLPSESLFQVFASNDVETVEVVGLYTIPTIEDNIFSNKNETENHILSEMQKKRMEKEIDIMSRAKRVEDLYKRYNAPMAANAEYLVRTADKYGVDYKLIVAISIIESGGGKVCFRQYNPFGWGRRDFDSFNDAIYTVTKGLSTGYYGRGLNTVEKIGPVYNAGDVEGWIHKVNRVMNQI